MDNKINERGLLELLYSGEPANDFLAFEVIKHLEDRRLFKFPLISLLVSKTDPSLRKEVYEYLEPVFSEFQKQNLKFFPRRGYHTIGVYGNDLKRFCSAEETGKILYVLFKRGNGNTQDFLTFTNKEHPGRKEVIDFRFQQEYKQGKSNNTRIDLSVFYPDEMDKFMKNVIQEFQSGGGNLANLIFSLVVDLSLLKSNKFPPIVFNSKEVRLMIYEKGMGMFLIKSFPKLLLSFKDIFQLTMKVSKDFDTHFDWSHSYGVRHLILEYIDKCIISDFSFLVNIPRLELAEFKAASFKFSHPSIFLDVKHFDIRVIYKYFNRNEPTVEFESTDGYSIHPNLKLSTWMEIVKVLGRSNLSYPQKIKYLKQLSTYENATDVSMLSLDEIKELLKGKAIRLRKNHSTNQIQIAWHNYRIGKNGEEFLERFINNSTVKN